ncbi:MAG: winged helix-turn-helix transcriptional regulator [Desulfobacteraceae bacterium]|nr:winged helix-turn-helix transcriptional regulator [Desulfobacteraceae bacterium]
MSEKRTVIDKRIFYKLNISQRLLMKYFDREMLDKLGASVNQIAALFYISQNNGCLFKDLSNVLFQNKSATTTMVERMIKNDLIEKKNSETDGRASQIFLTDKGWKISHKAGPIVKLYNDRLMEKFDKNEIETIHKFLDFIIENYS